MAGPETSLGSKINNRRNKSAVGICGVGERLKTTRLSGLMSTAHGLTDEDVWFRVQSIAVATVTAALYSQRRDCRQQRSTKVLVGNISCGTSSPARIVLLLR